MKTRSIFLSSSLLAATVLFLFSNCSGKKESDAEHSSHDSDHTSETTLPKTASEPQFQVDEQFQQQLSNAFASYIELKDAFVSSDAEKAREKAKQAGEALSKVDMKLLSGAAHNDWMNYLSPIQATLNEIQSATDIEAQRDAFSTLSDNLYKSIKAFGLGGKEAYYEYCPMAFNNEGGYWLSDNEAIRNPYFGDKMLTCGSIEEKLK